MEIIKKAVRKKASALSEYESKMVLAEYDVPVTREFLVKKMKDAVEKAEELGYPVVLKGSGRELLHKTEMDVVKVGLKNAREVRAAFKEIKDKVGKPFEGILVQEMVKGQRELVIGLIRDAQFGPCVMFGLGGIYTEILKDVSFRVAPLEKRDALEMMEEIKGKKILDAFRGMEPADRETLVKALIGLGRLGMEQDKVKEVDINPLILTKEGKPVAVDALVVLEGPKEKSK